MIENILNKHGLKCFNDLSDIISEDLSKHNEYDIVSPTTFEYCLSSKYHSFVEEMYFQVWEYNEILTKNLNNSKGEYIYSGNWPELSYDEDDLSKYFCFFPKRSIIQTEAPDINNDGDYLIPLDFFDKYFSFKSLINQDLAYVFPLSDDKNANYERGQSSAVNSIQNKNSKFILSSLSCIK